MRALLGKKLPIITLTATAKKTTMEAIVRDLGMVNCQVVTSNPDRPNIRYSVIEVGESLYGNFQWLIEKLHQFGRYTDRYLIFCRKMDHASQLFEVFTKCLGKKAYHDYQEDGTNDDRNRLFGMFHSKTDEEIQAQIISSFSKADGVMRVLFCTTAFSMGVNTQGVFNVIHYGPSNDTADYLQETGRAGRDGTTPSHAVLLKYKYSLNSKLISQDMKAYVVNKVKCRRVTLVKEFHETIEPGQPSHSCCDTCASQCKCFCKCSNAQACACEGHCPNEVVSDTEKHLCGYSGHQNVWQNENIHHNITPATRNAFLAGLLDFQYSLLQHIPLDKLLTGIDIATGFTTDMIHDIAGHMEYINTPDVLKNHFTFFCESHLQATWDIFCNIIEAEPGSNGEDDDSDIDISKHKVHVLTSSSEDEGISDNV